MVKSKGVTYCYVITTTIQYFVKNIIVERCWYIAATVKLRSVITFTYTGIIMYESYFYIRSETDGKFTIRIS